MKYQEIYLFFFFVNLEKCRTKRELFLSWENRSRWKYWASKRGEEFSKRKKTGSWRSFASKRSTVPLLLTLLVHDRLTIPIVTLPPKTKPAYVLRCFHESQKNSIIKGYRWMTTAIFVPTKIFFFFFFKNQEILQLDLFSWKINRFEKYFYLLQNLEIDFHAIFASQNYLEIRKIACILKSRKKKRKISSTIIRNNCWFIFSFIEIHPRM